MNRGDFMNRNYIFLVAKCLLCVAMLMGCGKKIDITYDNQYGVRYTVNSNGNESFVLIKLDPNNQDVVSMLRIWIHFDESDKLSKDVVAALQKSSNNTLSYMDEMVSTFFYQESDMSSFYVVNLNFYMDDQLKSSMSNEAKELIDYIGLSDELKDNVLYYEAELKHSQNFKYKSIIEEGSFNNNISLLQLKEYAYPKNKYGK